jgi:hypothetical protein
MGLLIFSFVVATIIGGSVWLAVGDRLPLHDSVKWDSRSNFLCYVAISFVGVFLLVFIFSDSL